jgi:hypothetical protein
MVKYGNETWKLGNRNDGRGEVLEKITLSLLVEQTQLEKYGNKRPETREKLTAEAVIENGNRWKERERIYEDWESKRA